MIEYYLIVAFILVALLWARAFDWLHRRQLRRPRETPRTIDLTALVTKDRER